MYVSLTDRTGCLAKIVLSCSILVSGLFMTYSRDYNTAKRHAHAYTTAWTYRPNNYNMAIIYGIPLSYYNH